MAKGRVRKSGRAEPDAPGAKPEIGSAAAGGAPEVKPKVRRKIRKQLRRLERQLADAAKSEARRVRRLEKARWRRQLLQAALDETKTASSVRPVKAPKPAPKPRPKRKTTAAADPKTAPAAPGAKAAGAKPVAPKPAAPKPPAAKPAAPKPAAGAKPAGAAKGNPQLAEAYCLREKKRVQMVDPKPVVTANGGSALSGTCPSCGAALYKLISRTAR